MRATRPRRGAPSASTGGANGRGREECCHPSSGSRLTRSYGQYGGRFLGLTCYFAGMAGRCSGYFKLSGMAAPTRVKASR
jgi:hypothetical protein